MSSRLSPALVFLFLLGGLSLYGQGTVKGKLFNSISREPIPYANIGIKNSNVGTISNKDGSFAIIIPQNLLDDSLSFSSIGFGSRQIPVKYCLKKNDVAIFLHQKTVLLNPVIVNSKKEKTQLFEFGNDQFNGGVLEADTTYAGRSVSLLGFNKFVV